jgi:hypothetical protein
MGALSTAVYAEPISYSWTDQGVAFTLEVEDFGTRVDALLRVDRTLDTDTDLLAGVSVKIFSDADVANLGSLISATNTTDALALSNWVTFGGGVGGHTGLFSEANGLGLGTQPSSSGFFSAAVSELGGEETGNVYEFLFRWDPTDASALGGPSIKAITVETNSKEIKVKGKGTGEYVDKKSRQWSSGELNPDAPAPPTTTPEPATLALVALGAAGYLIARRRKRAS